MSSQTSDNYHSPLADKVIAELRLEASANAEMCEDCGIPLTPGALPDGTPTLGCDECGFSWDMEGNDYEPGEKAKEGNVLPSPATALYLAEKAARKALVEQLATTAAEWGAVSEKAIIYATNHPTVVQLDAALKAWEEGER